MEEPNFLIRWTIYFFAGGSSAIWGATALAAILTLSLLSTRKTRVSPILKLVGGVISMAFIACGSPPVPGWFQWSFAFWIVCAVLSTRSRPSDVPSESSSRPFLRAAVARLWRLSPAIWLLGFLLQELPWHCWAHTVQPVRQMLVIGDSVTAGLNDHDVTWPRLLAEESDVDLFDASQPGATLESARKQNQLLSNRPGLTVLEIGGNDMLEGLPPSEFERQLDKLLEDVVQSDRTVIMFELPLPPFCAKYGAAQRRQSLRHGVPLIPKRLFASVLTTQGATVDGIHLSSAGQAQMKSLVRGLIGTSLPSGTGNYQRLERRARGRASP